MPFLVRLACVRHAASVDSEPGSNSQIFLSNSIFLTGFSVWLSKNTALSCFNQLLPSRIIAEEPGHLQATIQPSRFQVPCRDGSPDTTAGLRPPKIPNLKVQGRVAQSILDTSSRPEAAPTFSKPQGPEGGSRLSAANGPSNHSGNTPSISETWNLEPGTRAKPAETCNRREARCPLPPLYPIRLSGLE